MKKFFLLIALITLVDANVMAATGCLRGGQVYTTPPSGWSQWANPIPDNCTNGASISTPYAKVNSVTTTACTVGFLGLSGSGFLVDYEIEFCPIDDYIPIILVITGATTSYFLRRNFLDA